MTEGFEALGRKIEPPVRKFLSTGITLLDLAIAGKLPGGVPCGRITHIYGKEASAKTAILTEILGAAQRDGGRAYVEDAEGTFDFGRADLFGLDCNPDSDSFFYHRPQSLEALFDTRLAEILDECEDFKGPVTIGVDSLSAIPSMVELNSKLEDPTFGTSRAKQLSTAFRKNIWRLCEQEIALVFIDQTRMNVGGYGKTYIVSSGEAIKFYSSVCVSLKMTAKIENKKKRPMGVRIGFEVEKNKVGCPFRYGDFTLLFDYGIDDTWSNLEWLCQMQKEIDGDKKVKWHWKDLAGRNLIGLIENIEEANREDEVIEDVATMWDEIWAPLKRKEKVRK